MSTCCYLCPLRMKPATIPAILPFPSLPDNRRTKRERGFALNGEKALKNHLRQKSEKIEGCEGKEKKILNNSEKGR